MEYYKLVYDYTNDERAVLLNIDENTLDFNRYDVNKAAKLGVDKIFCTVDEENYSQYDYFANNLSWLIVSSRIKDILVKCNLGMYEFVSVINRNNEEVIGYLVHCMNIMDAFDEKNSICTRKKYDNNGKTYELLSVLKYAVDVNKIGNIDMFKLIDSEIPVFVSQKLKNMLIKNEAKGFDFMKIKS